MHTTIDEIADGIYRLSTFVPEVAALAPKHCDTTALLLSDSAKRADMIVENLGKLRCPRVITPQAIVQGHSRMNFSLIAHLFVAESL